MNACKVLELVSNDKIEELKGLAELEIKEKETKEKGGNKELRRFRAAQRYIKNIEKKCIAGFNGTWIEDEKQCFSDGYTGFILENKIDALPQILKPNFDLHTVLKNIDATKEINVNINEIKTALKIHKSTHRKNKLTCEYNLGISLYNAEYIVNCYDILGSDVVFKQSETNELSPAILENQNGIAILLPIRKNSRASA